jgi:3-mercaptopyruvate sulfurtransferase SseA
MSSQNGTNRTHASDSLDTQIEMDTFDARMEHRFRKLEQQMPPLKRCISDVEPEGINGHIKLSQRLRQ